MTRVFDCSHDDAPLTTRAMETTVMKMTLIKLLLFLLLWFLKKIIGISLA